MKPLEKKEKLKEEFKKRKSKNNKEPKKFEELGLDFLPDTFEYFRNK